MMLKNLIWQYHNTMWDRANWPVANDHTLVIYRSNTGRDNFSRGPYMIRLFDDRHHLIRRHNRLDAIEAQCLLNDYLQGK